MAIGAWVAIASALGLTFDLLDAKAAAGATKLPNRIRLRDFPQPKKLAWQLHGVEQISPPEALDLYGVTRAQLWQAIRTVARQLLA